MYKLNKIQETALRVNDSFEGETIEKKIRRIMLQNEPITDGAPRIYTERKDGVKPEYDIRTDRFELAVDGTDYITKNKIAERENRLRVIKGNEESSDTDVNVT